MIKEAYVSVEVAKLLKEKGFDTPVNYEYHYILKVPQFHRKKHNFNGIEYSNCSSEWYSAPTQQMVMAWLREVHKLHIGIVRGPSGYHITIETIPFGVVKYITREIVGTPYVDSYEEAVEVALKYVLENLI